MTVPSPEFYTTRWQQAAIPPKHWGERLEDYEPIHASGRLAKRIANDFADNFRDHYVSPDRLSNGDLPADRHNMGKGLMFYGRNGTRKTTLAVATLTDVQYRARAWRGYYIRFSEWKARITDTFVKEPTERSLESRRILNIVERVPLLLLDDIGQEHRTASGFTESMLHEMLRVRYEACRPTIITTNVYPDQMNTVYGTSFDSFRHDAFETIELLGQDSRKI